MKYLYAALIVAAPAAAQQNYPANIAAQVSKVHAANGAAARYKPAWDSLAAYRTPDWFRDAKFGIFLHWGVYSVPAFGNEWYSRNLYIPKNPAYAHHVATYGTPDKFGYKDFVPLFRAEHFDPNSWLDLFTAAGARYVVPVAEHCDGFPMYASGMTEWNAAQMGPHRDIVGELAEATRKHHLRFGVSSHTAEHWWWYGAARQIKSDVASTPALYGPAAASDLPSTEPTNYSHQPDPSHLERWLPPDKAFVDAWLARSTELIDKYQPDFFYFDWWIGQPAFKPGLQQFAAYYYNQSANRHQQPVLTYKEESMPADTATLDIERGKLDTLRLLPWQTDTSISIHSWGYVEHDEYRSSTSLIAQLLDTVAKNGNLLLNVGPRADGTIPEEARKVLLEMGSWLKVNGEAIYNTRPFTVFGEGPTKAPKNATEKNNDIQVYTPQDIRYTVSADGRTLYASTLALPAAGDLTLHTLYAGNPYVEAICGAKILGDRKQLSFRQSADGLHLPLPAETTQIAIALSTHCTK